MVFQVSVQVNAIPQRVLTYGYETLLTLSSQGSRAKVVSSYISPVLLWAKVHRKNSIDHTIFFLTVEPIGDSCSKMTIAADRDFIHSSDSGPNMEDIANFLKCFEENLNTL